jgi:4a-hydroxytetrahydrobiopterin dehydratase
MLQKLSHEAIEAGLKSLPLWRLEGEEIQRIYAFADFTVAMAFVNRVAELAERAQHHPDIDIRYSRVRLALTTHDANGLTSNDLAMARQIDQLSEGTVRP